MLPASQAPALIKTIVAVIALMCCIPCCSDVRLSGGSSNRGGRVEVLVSGSWVGLMAKLWDKPQADLICHQLGYVLPGCIINLF